MAEYQDAAYQDTAAGDDVTAGCGEDDRPDAATLAAELDECRSQHLRALADFDNYRRRAARELDRVRESERDRVVGEWIPVVDDLDRALAHAAADPATLMDGVRGVRERAIAALRRSGVTRFDEVRGPFDPTRHEVGGVVADARTPAGDVVDVLRPGYVADGRVLRPASVTVATREGQS